MLFGPWNVPLRLAHCCWVVMWQNDPLPAPMQQAPTCGGGPQVVLVHTVPAPWNDPPCAAQLADDVITQKLPIVPGAFWRQHAPICGCEHPAFAHDVPAPWKSPLPASHWVCVVCTHPPLGVQHAPVLPGPQVVLLQVVPDPWKVPPLAAQLAGEVITQNGG